MMWNVKVIKEDTLRARDGTVGGVFDLYFEDRTWTVPYLVVDIGNWLIGRRVLLPSSAIAGEGWLADALPVDLSIEEVQKLPEVDTDVSVSHPHEVRLNVFQQLNRSRRRMPAQGVSSSDFNGVSPLGGGIPSFAELRAMVSGQSAFRSANDVLGYQLHTPDGLFGYVSDFLIDCSSWSIRYIVVDTGRWLRGRCVVLPRGAIAAVNWEEESMLSRHNRSILDRTPEIELSIPSPGYLVEIDHYYRCADLST